MADMIAKSGFYDGKFRKAGHRHSGPASDDVSTAGDEQVVDLDAMTKDELVAEAEKRGLEVKSSDTKAEILAALKA
ncbi:hypothetical protein ABID21_000664 [Pseudorhizobium tarimense]|uniref:Rho termination factor, N-terminal domain n=1 Tax=Pseudorhizobium tarimense TaxID=1079109 RepID=A0ABV2H258_9HYPH|nr:hypothetical protein [Pseudorhizobium tarimense]MCJ8517820.1 hypothetical protein [Pseudorhizobium tarimense]